MAAMLPGAKADGSLLLAGIRCIPHPNLALPHTHAANRKSDVAKFWKHINAALTMGTDAG